MCREGSSWGDDIKNECKAVWKKWLLSAQKTPNSLNARYCFESPLNFSICNFGNFTLTLSLSLINGIDCSNAGILFIFSSSFILAKKLLYFNPLLTHKILKFLKRKALKESIKRKP